jgi:hypothetical protein
VSQTQGSGRKRKTAFHRFLAIEINLISWNIAEVSGGVRINLHAYDEAWRYFQQQVEYLFRLLTKFHDFLIRL